MCLFVEDKTPKNRFPLNFSWTERPVCQRRTDQMLMELSDDSDFTITWSTLTIRWSSFHFNGNRYSQGVSEETWLRLGIKRQSFLRANWDASVPPIINDCHYRKCYLLDLFFEVCSLRIEDHFHCLPGKLRLSGGIFICFHVTIIC